MNENQLKEYCHNFKKTASFVKDVGVFNVIKNFILKGVVPDNDAYVYNQCLDIFLYTVFKLREKDALTKEINEKINTHYQNINIRTYIQNNLPNCHVCLHGHDVRILNYVQKPFTKVLPELIKEVEDYHANNYVLTMCKGDGSQVGTMIEDLISVYDIRITENYQSLFVDMADASNGDKDFYDQVFSCCSIDKFLMVARDTCKFYVPTNCLNYKDDMLRQKLTTNMDIVDYRIRRSLFDFLVSYADKNTRDYEFLFELRKLYGSALSTDLKELFKKVEIFHDMTGDPPFKILFSFLEKSDLNDQELTLLV